MFAILAIVLPSEHTGGDVVVSLRDERITLKPESSTNFECAYRAWYADVNHSVEEVQSGHRLDLTSNLIRAGNGSSGRASLLDNHTANLTSVLSFWDKAREENTATPWHAVHVLEHAYSGANISHDHLKGNDQLQEQHVMEACREQDFCCYLARLEYSKCGGCNEDEDDGGDHPIIDEVDYNYKLTALFTFDGKQLAQDLRIYEEELIQPELFEDAEPDDEDYEG